jgi:hypothetical protein
VGKFGCSSIAIGVVALVIGFAFPPFAWLMVGAVAVGGAVSFFTQRSKKQTDQAALEFALNSQAAQLDALALAGFQETADFVMEPGEKFLTRIPQLQLAEYQSTGSSYGGGNAGVSVPLFGQVRGYVGGSRGQVTKNPPALTPIDVGPTTFTNKRVIFTGSQQTRIWELDKILNTEGGPNGIFVSISVSNSKSTSVLYEVDRNAIAPGVILDLAQESLIAGEAEALAKAKIYAGLMREAVAAQYAPK